MSEDKGYTCAYTRVGVRAMLARRNGSVWLGVRRKWLLAQHARGIDYIAVHFARDASLLASVHRLLSAPAMHIAGLACHAMPIVAWDVQGSLGAVLEGLLRRRWIVAQRVHDEQALMQGDYAT
ncbi:MAG: hypothetical protein N2545_10075 [Thermoflexales bacterium]|nr:hypothetical protein [Thermoflexales bacterium]